MKVLIASTPAIGHVNPMFSIARMLAAEGHEVVGLSATAMRGHVERAGASFRAFPKAADLDFRDVAAVFPELKDIPPGPEMSRFYMTRAFFDPVPAQYEGLRQILAEFAADIILVDNMFYGALPMLLGPRSERPAIVACGTMFLHFARDDGAPNFAGLAPATTAAQAAEYGAIFKQHEAAVYGPALDHLNDRLAGIGVGPLSMHVLDASIVLPDAFLQLTAPSFEFPRRNLPASVHFVGSLPIIPSQASLPPWADELDGSLKVVLATQGTVSNHNFGQLIAPTLAALANEPDLLVVVTTGGRPIDAVPGPIPANARLATYLPLEWLLPKTDVLVTNGGYGTVNQALTYGVPLVTAGLTEDKADVNARVAWSGVGIDLRTNEPTPSALHEAVRSVLDRPDHRTRAAFMAELFGKIDTRREILRILEALMRKPREEGARETRKTKARH
jgi:MGT family glycosyltransferase